MASRRKGLRGPHQAQPYQGGLGRAGAARTAMERGTPAHLPHPMDHRRIAQKLGPKKRKPITPLHRMFGHVR